MTAGHCPCQLWGGGAFELQGVSSVEPSETLKILNFKIPKRGQKTTVAIYFLLCTWKEVKGKLTEVHPQAEENR